MSASRILSRLHVRQMLEFPGKVNISRVSFNLSATISCIIINFERLVVEYATSTIYRFTHSMFHIDFLLQNDYSTSLLSTCRIFSCKPCSVHNRNSYKYNNYEQPGDRPKGPSRRVFAYLQQLGKCDRECHLLLGGRHCCFQNFREHIRTVNDGKF